MLCEKFGELILDYLENSLTEEETLDFEIHLLKCYACEENLQKARIIFKAMKHDKDIIIEVCIESIMEDAKYHIENDELEKALECYTEVWRLGLDGDADLLIKMDNLKDQISARSK